MRFALLCGAVCALAAAVHAAEPTHIGAEACRTCHPAQFDSWRGSQHALAMQVASPSVVLGDFQDRSITHFGVTSTFFRKDGDYFVNTQGADGELSDFRVAYAFGVDPLQQYLVEFPDGRKQVMPFCWDSRPKAAGGQRWFHLYPDEPLPPGDALHWGGSSQNWNHMCADCHSTHLRKRFDEATQRFDTRWAQLNVACEACHGPGSEHAASARAGKLAGTSDASLGLTLRFDPVARASYPIDAGSGQPHRVPARGLHTEVETCGRCHSRRAPLREGNAPEGLLADTHRVSLLVDPLYFADGQIRDEVYVYGSFLQSKMYAAGVSCSDCHDPHSGTLRAQGNALCGNCHVRARYDVASHHGHAKGSVGTSCVACHMPERTYMQVDPRRDHSLRIPRPALSQKVGSPLACHDCHEDQSHAWAKDAIASWRGGKREVEKESDDAPHWGEALHAGRSGARDAGRQLAGLVVDLEVPAIVRATALAGMPFYPGQGLPRLLQGALRDPSPLVRTAALTTADALDPRTRLQIAGAYLADPVRSVRLEAARILADVPPAALPPELASAHRAALSEYLETLQMDADRPEAHLRRAGVEVRRGDLDTAEQSLHKTLALAPWLIPASVNLADLYRIRGQDELGEKVLRDALLREPGNGDLHHALGLLLVRSERAEAAMDSLSEATRLRPDVSRYAFVYAVALHSVERTEEARTVLEAAAVRHPGDPQIANFARQLREAP